MAKNKTTAVATKGVSEDTIALSLQQRYDDANRTIAQKAIIFGATLVAAERELERRGLLKSCGRGSGGDGLKGWLAEHCPEIAYKTAMRWRQIAEAQVAALQSKGVGSEDDAIKMLQMDDDGLSVPPTKKALKCRDEIMATPSLRKITQDMFDFAKDKPGRPKGTGAAKLPGADADYSSLRRTTPENASRAYATIWTELEKKRHLPQTASVLPVEDAKSILDLMDPVYQALKRRVGEKM